MKINHFTKRLNEYSSLIRKKEEEIKSINKQLKQLPNKKETEEKYVEFVRENIIRLGAWNAAYEDNIKLLTPIKAQGTLENKIILATMDYEEFDPQNIRRAYITKLSEKQKLLNEETYISNKDQIEEIWELLKSIN